MQYSYMAVTYAAILRLSFPLCSLSHLVSSPSSSPPHSHLFVSLFHFPLLPPCLPSLPLTHSISCSVHICTRATRLQSFQEIDLVGWWWKWFSVSWRCTASAYLWSFSVILPRCCTLITNTPLLIKYEPLFGLWIWLFYLNTFHLV